MAKATSKWILPSLHKVTSVKDLFEQLHEVNRKHRSFSYRSLATRLKWPLGYIPDLLKGRRKLTIKRCVQLSQFFGADPIDTERIIFLSLKEYSDDGRDIFDQRLSARKNEKIEPTQDFSMLQVSVQLIEECLRWFQKPMTLAQLQFLLQRCRFSQEELQSALQLLIEKKIVQKKGEQYSSKGIGGMSEDLGVDLDFFRIHHVYADTFKKLIDPPVRPGFVNTNYVFLHPEKIKEIHEKLFSFRTWLRDMSEADLQKATSQELLLFQFDLNLLPVFGKDIASQLVGKKS